MGGKPKLGGSDAAEHSPVSIGNDYVGATGSAGWTSIVRGNPDLGSMSVGARGSDFKIGAAAVGLAGNSSYDFDRSKLRLSQKQNQWPVSLFTTGPLAHAESLCFST